MTKTISRYPKGFNGPVSINNLPLVLTGTKFLYVGADPQSGASSPSDANSGTEKSPLATIAAALDRATSGYTIIINSGHSETFTSNLFSLGDADGVTIIGRGNGKKAPLFNINTANISWTISAHDFSLMNVRFKTTLNGIESPIQITNCENSFFDIQTEDGSALNIATSWLAIDQCSNLNVNVKHLGFQSLAGGIYHTSIQSSNDIFVNYSSVIGSFSSSIVAIDISGTPFSKNVYVTGVLSNFDASDGSKNISANASSGWSANIWDARASQRQTGGTNLSLAFDSTRFNSALPYVPKTVVKSAAVMTNNDVIFTVQNGDIRILSLYSKCITANGASATTIQWRNTASLTGTSATFTGTSGSLANAIIGTTVSVTNTTLGTAPLISAGGATLVDKPGSLIVMAGTLNLVVSTGPTTGTWEHYLSYYPLDSDVVVTAGSITP